MPTAPHAPLGVFATPGGGAAGRDLPLRVLLVEDSARDVALLEAYLTVPDAPGERPFVVRHVTRLADARRAVAGEEVDVVLLDLSLPDADGLEAVDALLAEAPDLPVVVLTGTADDALAMTAVRAGAQDYLVKGREGDRAVRRALRHAVERQQLVRAARQATRARDETLAIVSHDLRNALGGIDGCVQALRGDAPVTPERLARSLDAAERAARWMDRLIRDLLDVSRLEAGLLSLHPEPVPANTLASSLVGAFAPEAESRGVTLVATPAADAPWIHVDPERLFQALGNLVGNALKFTGAGGRVTVQVGPPAADDGMVAIGVTDTGQGIDAEQLGHVFDRFWQARSARRSGAGLGLAIAKGIVEAHGGAIAVDSAVGEGTTFTCRIPGVGRDGR